MSLTISPAPVRKEITVTASQARAFETFTRQIGTWWIKGHSISASGQAEVVIEPRIGGAWYEIGTSGERCDWGRVLAWEPPARLVLTWQINASWAYDPNLITEVEVQFTALDAARTKVTLEHRGFESYGENAAALREQYDSDMGWAGLLRAFADSSL